MNKKNKLPTQNKITDYINSKGQSNLYRQVSHKKNDLITTYQLSYDQKKQNQQKYFGRTRFFNQNQQQYNKKQFQNDVVKQMIMIGPSDVNYCQNQIKKIKHCLNFYNKQHFFSYLQSNINFHGGHNLYILFQIDNQLFWKNTLPKMLSYASDISKLKTISSNIQILISNATQLLHLSRAKILMILISMFFCMLPKQSYRQFLSFAQLFGLKQNQKQFANMKLQKLKCFINYFNIILNRPYHQLQQQQICIQRVKNQLTQHQLINNNNKMSQIQIQKGLIQDQYKKCTMISFSNKKIGGGVLGHGALQQQIMFCMFPQLVSLMCTCEQLLYNEALIISGAEKYNDCTGYSHTLKFNGTSRSKIGPSQSLIVAIDAVDYTTKLNIQCQYSPSEIRREIMKAVAGIQGAQVLAIQSLPICTGKWGCGVFKGDPILKFLIQWIACSVAGKKLVYKCSNQAEIKELKVMAKFFKQYSVSSLLSGIKQCNDIKQAYKKISFIDILQDVI